MVIPTTYLGPIPLYASMLHAGSVEVEQHDHYVKQTFRNRCVIAGPNGMQTLTIPVEKGHTPKCLMRDLRISDHGNWRHLHWNALESSYGKSPFFEFYADDLHPFYTERRWTFLVDFNEELMHLMLDLMDVEVPLSRTASYAAADLSRWAEPCALSSLPFRPYYQAVSYTHLTLPTKA